jgi:hypothetical protein
MSEDISLAATKEADLMELAKAIIDDIEEMRVINASSGPQKTIDSSQKKELAARRARVHTPCPSKSGY